MANAKGQHVLLAGAFLGMIFGVGLIQLCHLLELFQFLDQLSIQRNVPQRGDEVGGTAACQTSKGNPVGWPKQDHARYLVPGRK